MSRLPFVHYVIFLSSSEEHFEKMLRLKWTRNDPELAQARSIQSPSAQGKQPKNMTGMKYLANSL